MKIDKTKLKNGIWYEDANGNRIEHDENSVEAPIGAYTYHSCFPLQVTESIYTCHSEEEKNKCKHKRKFHKKDNGLVKGYKGRICTACGCHQTRKWYQFWGNNWDCGSTITPLIDFHTTIGGGNEDVILAMANSGDYTLSEAITVFGNACERCMNVLAYKYLNGKDGYEEYSEEWKKANTVCDFCKHENE